NGTNTQDDFGALAIVVDSSVALAANWSLILSSYFGPYLRGLMEQYPGTYRIGFVTYGTSDSLPSSVLCKRFFTDFTPVTNVMKDTEEIQQLSLGSTPSGGTRGMAALEGLVAAIELASAPALPCSCVCQLTTANPNNVRQPHCVGVQPPFPILQAFHSHPANQFHPKYPWPGLPPEITSLGTGTSINSEASLPTAQQAGDFSKAEAIKNDLAKGNLYFKLRLQPPVPPGAGSNSSGSQPQSQPTPNSNPNPSQPPSNRNPNLAPLLLLRHLFPSIASTAASASASGLQVPPSICRSLWNRTGGNKVRYEPEFERGECPQQQQPGQGMDGSSMNMNPGNMGMPGQPGGPTQQPPGAPPAGGNASMAMANPQNGNNGPIPAWSGVLFLPGDPKSIRKDLKFAVSAMSANIAECRVNTWPTEMTLIQSHDSVVSHPEPVVCTLKPHARSSDVRQNMIIEQMFKGLEKMIMGRGLNIVSSWPLPSGAQTNNVIFAYVPNHGLIGAFFPVTGIPEMPKSVPGIPAVPVPGSSPALSASNIMTALAALKVPQEVAQRILQLPQEMQMQALRTLAQQQRSLGRGGPVGMPQGGMGVEAWRSRRRSRSRSHATNATATARDGITYGYDAEYAGCEYGWDTRNPASWIWTAGWWRGCCWW
ncbi:hypothetical protein BT96DRAFT_929750, partial [Gymnopus androsaceus JB14]